MRIGCSLLLLLLGWLQCMRSIIILRIEWKKIAFNKVPTHTKMYNSSETGKCEWARAEDRAGKRATTHKWNTIRRNPIFLNPKTRWIYLCEFSCETFSMKSIVVGNDMYVYDEWMGRLGLECAVRCAYTMCVWIEHFLAAGRLQIGIQNALNVPKCRNPVSRIRSNWASSKFADEKPWNQINQTRSNVPQSSFECFA